MLNPSDVVVVNIKSYKDDRGNFYKLFDDELKRYSKLKNPILEVNRSLTKKKGTIRGMHFQYPPYHETKLITCLRGSVKDIIVDIRQNSPTFLDYMSIKLDDVDNNMIVIPGGLRMDFKPYKTIVSFCIFMTKFIVKNMKVRCIIMIRH